MVLASFNALIYFGDMNLSFRNAHNVVFLILAVGLLLGGCIAHQPIMNSYSLRSAAIPVDDIIEDHLYLHWDAPRTTIRPVCVKYPVSRQPRYLALRIHPFYLPWYPEMDRGDLEVELSVANDDGSRGKTIAAYQHQNRYTDSTNLCDSLLALELPNGITNRTLRVDFGDASFDTVLTKPDELSRPGKMVVILDSDEVSTGYGYLMSLPSNSVLRSDRLER